MKIITIYELLGMVKDKVDVDTYIRYYDKLDNKTNVMLACKENIIYNLDRTSIELNDEVEILEEEKKIPKKLDIRQEKNIKNNWKWKVYGKEHSYNISTPQKIIADKLNEVIDYLKSKGE